MAINDPQQLANLLYVASATLFSLFLLGLIWVLLNRK